MGARGEVLLCSHENGGRRKKVMALFDSGASMSVISEKVAEELGYEKFDKPKELPLATEDKKARLIGETRVEVEMEKCRFPVSDIFGVIEGLRHDAIIGRDLMDKYDILLSKEKPQLKKCPPELELISIT